MGSCISLIKTSFFLYEPIPQNFLWFEFFAANLDEEWRRHRQSLLIYYLVDQDFQKQIKILNKRIKQSNEKLKPLGKKKYLPLYIDVKNRSKTLKARLNALEKVEKDLPKKVKKKIIKKADALSTKMGNIGKKPKKKIYKVLSEEIRSLTKMLRETSAA